MSIRFFSFGFTLAAAIATSIATSAEAQYQGGLDRSSDQYKRCIRAISIDAEQAFQQANRWRRQGGGASAEHCEALSLVEMGAFDAAAPMLSKLAADQTTGGEKLRASLHGQAGNTWVLAGKVDKGLSEFADGIALMPTGHWMSAEFMIDRSRALSTVGRWQEAESEASGALENFPEHLDALVLRAASRRELDDPVGALADIEAALAIDPNSADALAERGFLKKRALDYEGAKKDFERVLEIAPESHAAALALNGLAKLAVHDIN